MIELILIGLFILILGYLVGYLVGSNSTTKYIMKKLENKRDM